MLPILVLTHEKNFANLSEGQVRLTQPELEMLLTILKEVVPEFKPILRPVEAPVPLEALETEDTGAEKAKARSQSDTESLEDLHCVAATSHKRRRSPDAESAKRSPKAWNLAMRGHLKVLLQKQELQKWFSQAVNLERYPTYLKTIYPNAPMDLGRVLSTLETNQYSSLDECMHDIEMIWENALKFNRPGSKPRAAAQQAQEMLLDLMSGRIRACRNLRH